MPWGQESDVLTYLIDTGLNVPAPVQEPGSYVARVKCVFASVRYFTSIVPGQYMGDIRCEAAPVFGEAFYIHGAPFNTAADPIARAGAQARLYVRVRVTVAGVGDNVTEVRPEQFDWRVDRLT